MKLRQDQLVSHLQKGLSNTYLVSGDEPLLVMEACDAIRAKARSEGIEERYLFHAEAGFDWNLVREEANALSLFASRKIIEVRIPNAKPSDKGASIEAIATLCDQNTVLLIVCPRLDVKTQKTKWVKALDQSGILLPIWPIERQQYPGWLKRRTQQAGLQLEPSALSLLAAQTEGNLLAAVQEIEKLKLMGLSNISEDNIRESIGDHARFDAFSLADTCLLGQTQDAVRMLSHLLAEGIEPIMILGALLRKTRQLISLNGLSGQSLSEAFKRNGIWPKQQPPFKSALQRLNENELHKAISLAARIDASVKGSGDDTRLLLSELVLLLCGQKLINL